MSDTASPTDPPPTCVIDLDQAVAVDLPPGEKDLSPSRFVAPDGRPGWSLRIPGKRPIATPAYADGLLFVGGGYGSYEFYAFHALTGELAWKIRTADDGPTAAVVENGLVAFNTESCTVIVCEAATGRVVWQEWLGDPLMGQPAIADGRLFMAYPSRHERPVLRPDMTPKERKAEIDAARGKRRDRFQHMLLCADLRTGEHIWEQEISGDVIVAPVVDAGQVFLTCFDGTSYCLDAADGTAIWHRDNAGTSSPLVVEGRVIMTEKDEQNGRIFERMRRSHRGSGEYSDPHNLSSRSAEYLHMTRGGGSSLRAAAASELDSGVGFAAAPQSSKLGAAARHLGVSTVSGAWAFQGSRPVYSRGHILGAQGRNIYSIRDDEKGTLLWEAEVRGSTIDPDDQVFLPPSLGREQMYIASTVGHLVAMRPDDGKVSMMYALLRPICFQPSLACGRIYLGTGDGGLICLESGQDDADGWHMWGGNAQHNRRT